MVLPKLPNASIDGANVALPGHCLAEMATGCGFARGFIITIISLSRLMDAEK